MISSDKKTNIKNLGLVEQISGTDLVLVSVNGKARRALASLLKGQKGDDIELQITSSHIQWRLKGGEWVNLISFATLRGPIEDAANDCIDATIDLRKLETEVSGNEEIRTVVEIERNTSEQGRQISEIERVTTENERKAAELLRNMAENTRIQTEKARIQAENGRTTEFEIIKADVEKATAAANTATSELGVIKKECQLATQDAVGAATNANEAAQEVRDFVNDASRVTVTETDKQNWNDKYTKLEVDSKDIATLQLSKQYTDGINCDLANNVYSKTETYSRSETDNKDAATLAASKEYAAAKIAEIVNSAPSTLDTLQELAAALGNDPNFATSIMALIAGKADNVHDHTTSQITDFPTALPANGGNADTVYNVPAWRLLSVTKNGNPYEYHQYNIQSRFDAKGDGRFRLEIVGTSDAAIYGDRVSVGHADQANNADIVAGSPAWRLQSVSQDFNTFGSYYYNLQSRFNVKGDGRFRLEIINADNSNINDKVSVEHADQANNADTVGGHHVKLNNTWNGIINKLAIVDVNGCLEIGKYIDFHDINSDLDFDIRLNATNGRLDCSGVFSASIFRDNWDVDDLLPIGLVGFKTTLEDGYHRFCSLETFKQALGTFITNRGTFLFNELNTFTNRESGTYRVEANGSSQTLIVFRSAGSTSAVEILSSYYEESRLQVRKTIDSSRQTNFKELAWLTDIPTTTDNLPDTAAHRYVTEYEKSLWSGKASAIHEHAEYALTNHAHSGYATMDHVHAMATVLSAMYEFPWNSKNNSVDMNSVMGLWILLDVTRNSVGRFTVRHSLGHKRYTVILTGGARPGDSAAVISVALVAREANYFTVQTSVGDQFHDGGFYATILTF